MLHHSIWITVIHIKWCSIIISISITIDTTLNVVLIVIGLKIEVCCDNFVICELNYHASVRDRGALWYAVNVLNTREDLLLS